jgi:hypothetical protein
MTRADRMHSTPRITASKTNPPDQAPMTPDDEIGMAWWNALTKQERAQWSAIAGNTGRPKDAWEAFRRGSMDQSPPVDPTRRRFLSQAAGAAAGGTVLALAAIPPGAALAAPASALDPVFALIEAHRTARAAYLVALAGRNRLDQIGDISADWEYETDADAFNDLIEMAPTTFAGLVAWASYLDEIRKVEAWMFEGEGTTLVVTLVEALGNLAVAS